ncbi:hypothetical protein [Desulfoferrobacter suflitae]|nr:hypothetical protein [Desulfoferrobacter suflitae]
MPIPAGRKKKSEDPAAAVPGMLAAKAAVSTAQNRDRTAQLGAFG